MTFQFDKPDPRMKAGASARVIDRRQGDSRARSTCRGRPCSQKNGKTHVFVKVGDRFEQREVKVVQRTESRVVVEGLPKAPRSRCRSDRRARRPSAAAPPCRRPERGDDAVTARPDHRARRGLPARAAPGLDNLRAHKLRSLLTMLGMIFGVAAVVAMLSIGAGAQQEVMAFIEQLGVRNLIVEAREATDWQSLQKVRKLSPGLTFQDFRVIQANLEGHHRLDGAQALHAVEAAAAAAGRRADRLRRQPGVHRDRQPAASSAAGSSTRRRRAAARRWRCSAKARGGALRRRRSDRPLRQGQRAVVPGDRRRRSAADGADRRRRPARAGSQQPDLRAAVRGDLPARGRNSRRRTRSTASICRCEPGDDIPAAAALLRGLLNVSHREAGDFTIVSPAELLAEQRRTQRIFEMVMVAIASISLLVGGIGIMNIMLASVMERTREIGVRRAIGAKRRDVIRQFLIETTIISLAGGVIGVLVGVGLSQLIGYLAGWSTIVTTTSIVLAFFVSVAIGLVFGLYPAARAAGLDPVKALHYEYPPAPSTSSSRSVLKSSDHERSAVRLSALLEREVDRAFDQRAVGRLPDDRQLAVAAAGASAARTWSKSGWRSTAITAFDARHRPPRRRLPPSPAGCAPCVAATRADDRLVGVERHRRERRVHERAEPRPERPLRPRAGRRRPRSDRVGRVDRAAITRGGHLRDRARRDRRRSSRGERRARASTPLPVARPAARRPAGVAVLRDEIVAAQAERVPASSASACGSHHTT